MREPEILDVTIDLTGHRSRRGVVRFLRDHGIAGTPIKNLDVARAFNLLADGYPVEGVCQVLRVRPNSQGAATIARMDELIRAGMHLVRKGGKP